MMRTTLRRAHKIHRCEGCESFIATGERYLEHVAAPNHDDLGNDHWWRLPECEACARRSGHRGHWFDAPITTIPLTTKPPAQGGEPSEEADRA